MYEQTLIKTVSPIKKNIIKKNNRYKKWEYGYNKEYDVVVISKDGTIGDVVEIQNLCIALPSVTKLNKVNNKWTAINLPKEFKNLKTIFDWETYPEQFKNKWYPYIDEEFERREKGYWFNNNNEPTYITGTHYMYLQWSKIDVGRPDYREANRIFYIFWEACKADYRSYGICYLKNRRSGFSFMASNG
jgi:hypothetical protein